MSAAIELKKEYEERLQIKLRVRQMFSAMCLFHDGIMFAIIKGDCIAVKVDNDVRKHKFGEGFFSYQKNGQVVKVGYQVLDTNLDERQIDEYLLQGLRTAQEMAKSVQHETDTFIRHLPNLNLNIEQKLAVAGVDTREKLFDIGATKAYEILVGNSENTKLYKKLKGAIEGKHWSLVS